MLKTLDYTIRIGSTPTFLYFDDVKVGAAYKILRNMPRLKNQENTRDNFVSVALFKSSETATGGSRVYMYCVLNHPETQTQSYIVVLRVCSGTNKELHHLGDVLVSSQGQVDFHKPTVNSNQGFTFGPTFDCNLELTQLFASGSFCCIVSSLSRSISSRRLHWSSF